MIITLPCGRLAFSLVALDASKKANADGTRHARSKEASRGIVAGMCFDQ